MKKITVIGAGLTGLTIAYLLRDKGYEVTVLEKDSKVGGAIQTHVANGYVFEEGPNTGVVSNPEVAELFDMLGLKIEEANRNAEKRLILKNGRWHPLPSGAVSFLKTPLFSAADKAKMMFEPFQKKGADPDESVASLAARRIGQSFVDYAVNPFISGIYAGDPEKLVTRYALPKLYRLEQDYGSFIKGSIQKSKIKKTARDLKATRKVFSVAGGLGGLIYALQNGVGAQNIVCDITDVSINKNGDEGYCVAYHRNGRQVLYKSDVVITTVGAYVLPEILPFISLEDMDAITDLRYAKIVQVAVGVKKNVLNNRFCSFGGLIPQKENRRLLGVLFPSYCFSQRVPEDCSVLAVYMGGIRHPEIFDWSDERLKKTVEAELSDLFGINERGIDFIHIFRHRHAIPQYEKSSGKRFEAINKIEEENKGLIVAGNLRNGIGMADRIKQAFDIVASF
ncbi:protoporphyrinogen oxidase [Dysgonomonas sp. 216]|uniref:protoporphyrinogen oxidase n=1 Tax=Dysgonomonas sp. 216 TaxID=2302934 RepID=UPI0013D02D44|nr:protoporphyrinogen oxidase [Dysgonomonas sp. 216]